MEAIRGANLDVTIARQAFLPSLTADFAWGIEANAFALHSTVAAFPDAAKIFEANMATLNGLGIEGWKGLFPEG